MIVPVRPRVDVVMPCYREGDGLRTNVRRLREAAAAGLGSYDWRLVLVPNGADPVTVGVAGALSVQYDDVALRTLQRAGRGGALRRVWLESDADVCVYVDSDLPFDLAALPLLVDAVASGAADIAVGSRFLPGSRVTGRRLIRRIASRVYLFLLRTLFDLGISDAQCGFKAIGREAVRDLAPRVKSDNWFFDSELLILARRRGRRIAEVPVACHDNSASTVRIMRTSLEFLRGLLRMKCTRAGGDHS